MTISVDYHVAIEVCRLLPDLCVGILEARKINNSGVSSQLLRAEVDARADQLRRGLAASSATDSSREVTAKWLVSG